MIIAMFIIVFIAVTLQRILRGQDKKRKTGGTDLPNLHTGQDDGSVGIFFSQEQPCLPLCCPHGQAWVLDGQSGEEVCGDQVIREHDMIHACRGA